MKRLLVIAMLGAAFVTAAHATTITYDLTQDLSSGTNLGSPTSLGNGVFAQVVLTQDGANVDVTETLASGVQFVRNGAGDSLMFNLTGNPTVTVTGLTSGFTFNQNTDTVGNSDFTYYVTCTGCGNGGSSPLSGPLSFTIDNVTLSQFTTAGGSTVNGYYFITDVLSNGHTGDVGDNAPGIPGAAAPEPSSLALMGTGVLGAAGLLRRKFNN